MNKFTIALSVVLAFALGATAMWAYDESRRDAARSFDSERFLDDMFSEDFFNHSRDPFREMERLRDRMDKLLRGDRLDFDTWFSDRFGDFRANTIDMEEDDDSVAYRIDIGDQDLVDTKVDVANGYVSIAVRLEDKSGSSISQSSLSHRFPVPAGVDPGSVKVDKEGDAIVIRFDKTA